MHMDSIFYWKLFNFAVFLTILTVLLRRPLKEFWKIRANEIGFHIKESTKLREDAEDKLKACQDKMAQVSQEIDTLVADLKEEGDLEKKKLQERAQEFAKQLKKDSQRQVDQEIRRVKEVLKEEIARLTVDQAQKIIAEKMTPEDENKLMNQYLEQLQEQKTTSLGKN